MTTPKKLRFWLVILILLGLGIGLRPDPALTEPPNAVATTLAAPLTGDHWRIDTFAGGEIGDNGPAMQARLDDPRGVAVDGAGNLYIADTGNHRVRRVGPLGTITTVAGTGESGFSGDSGPAVRARLNFPRGVAVDNAGNLLIADSGNHCVRRVDPSGTITTIAGIGAWGFSGDGGPAVAARLNSPGGLVVDSAGNLFIADRFNHRIRRVDPSGTITTIAGTGEGGFGGDGGPAAAAQLNSPNGVAVDSAGNLYIADINNHRIRRVHPSGVITTIAGTLSSGFSGDGGPAVAVRLSLPTGVAVDGTGNLFIAQSLNDRIRQVDPSGIITTIAGTRQKRFSGDNGPATQARLHDPFGLAADNAGNLFIADSNNDRIRRVDPSGVVTTIAGTGERGYSGDGGPAVAARLSRPAGVAVDGAGNLFIVDNWNHCVRRVTPFGTITTIAGTGAWGFSGDNGPAVSAQLAYPQDVAVDGAGNLFIVDTRNHRIRRVDPTGAITTVVGTGERGYSGDGGPAVTARLNYPGGIAVDRAGNLLIADNWNSRIRRVDPSGTITTITTQLSYPQDVAVDGAGNLFIADTLNQRIRRVDPSGTITTIAGIGRVGFRGDGGRAIAAQFNYPRGVAVGPLGNLYVADSYNHRIRILTRTTSTTALRPPTGLTATAVSSSRIDLTWQDNSHNETGFRVERRQDGSADWVEVGTTAANVNAFSDAELEPNSTYRYRVQAFNSAGASAYSNESVAKTLDAPLIHSRWRIDTFAGGAIGDNGPAIQAWLRFPWDLAVDGIGNLYIADAFNHRIRRVDTSGTITTIAGTGESGFSGDNGPAVQAQLDAPLGVAVDAAGNLYIADAGNNRIRRVDTSGTITTIAGTGEPGFGGDSGPAVEAQLYSPYGVAVDGAGNLYVADSGNSRIRRADASGTITTIAGTGEPGFSGDSGAAIEAQLSFPLAVAVDGTGNLYIADDRGRIRRVDTSGSITTIAGTGSSGFSGDHGPAVEAQLGVPREVAVDAAGNLYIADTTNHRIRRVDSSGTITTVAGTGKEGFSGDDGPAADAQLHFPYGVAVDGAGNLFISDTWNDRIRRVDPSGTITTFAGTGLYLPHGVAVDGSGSLFIADFGNQRIRRVDRSGTITTVAGTGERGFSGDQGPALAAQLQRPAGVAVDTTGNIFIADSGNHRIRRVDRSGTITTVAGTGEPGFSGDHGPAVAVQLQRPEGVVVDGAGNLFIADSRNNRIRRVDSSGTLTTIAGTGEYGFSGDGGPAAEARLASPGGLAVDGAGNLLIADVGNRRIRILTHSKIPTRLPGPTGLTATTVSSSRIDLTWRDNSNNETGFRVQRRTNGSSHWVEAGTTAANATTFSDGGLEPSTTYRYRVQAFNNAGASAFSNEVVATTAAAAPTVSGFAPAGGPVGTGVTVTGTRFLGATEVSFNGVNASEFEIMSTTRLRAVVPAEATSGAISVVTPDGVAVSNDHFTVTEAGFLNRLFVPIVLRLGGQAGSFYTSELTLTNRGSRQAGIGYSYTASIGSGSGTAVDSLGPGQQRIVPDAIAYLTSLGMPIGRGGAGGTLQVEFSGLSMATEGAVTVRTSTPVPGGRAGLTYPGLNATQWLDGPSWVTGLRQNEFDRSNLALQNAGKQDITLKVTVFSGDPAAPGSRVLPEISLGAGEFYQYNAILATAGFRQGYAKVEKTSGISPYYAYGVINDQANSDGSFVFPVTEDSLIGKTGQTLPVIVETEFFHSELTVTNFSPATRTVHFSFVADAIRASNSTAPFSLRLQAGEQRIIPKLVRQLRQEGLAGIGPPGPVIAGAVFATVETGDMSGIVIAARTGSPGGGGQFGVFYHPVPYGAASSGSAWIHGLQQNAENRSNMALVNTGEVDGSASDFSIDIHDGDTGQIVRTVSGLTVPARGWRQVNRILAQYAPGTRQGYVQVRQTSGNNPFIAYGIINDGAAPGQRSSDGAFLPSQP